MAIKLTDFTFKELLFMSMKLEEVQKEETEKMEMIKMFDPSTIKVELLEHHLEQWNLASLWRAQVESAMVFVKGREMVQDN